MIMNAHFVFNAIIRHAIIDPKTNSDLPPILNQAFTRLYSLHPLCDNPDALPDPLAVYRCLITDSKPYPCFQSTLLSQWIKIIQHLHELKLENHTLLTANDFDCSICSLPGANNPPSQRRFRLPCCKCIHPLGMLADVPHGTGRFWICNKLCSLWYKPSVHPNTPTTSCRPRYWGSHTINNLIL